MEIPDLTWPLEGTRAQYVQGLRLAEIAGKMQEYGILVDRDACFRHLVTARERQERFGTVFKELSGLDDIGLDGGTAAVKSFFWDTLKAPHVSLSKRTKLPKLDKLALIEYVTAGKTEELRKAAASLYAYRRNGKVIGYMTAYLEASSSDSRIHPRWNTIGTKTSRWSCTEPNVQQLSGRSPKFDFGNGPETLVDGLKDVLIADPGFVLVAADWSALELYLQTYIAGAQKLLLWMHDGKDLHMENAKAVLRELKIPADATKSTHKIPREIAKLFFGFSYLDGDHVDQVFKQMKDKMPAITLPLVQAWRKRYFNEHPEFLQMQERNRQDISDSGYITTPLMGRRLTLVDAPRGFNQAHNGKCQTTAGDLANIAILRLAEHVDWQNRVLLMQVHDSFVMQCREGDEKATEDLLVRCMTEPVDIYGIQAKFLAEAGHGISWADT